MNYIELLDKYLYNILTKDEIERPITNKNFLEDIKNLLIDWKIWVNEEINNLC